MSSSPRPPRTAEPGRYSAKRAGIGRLLLGILGLLWAALFLALALLRIDLSRPGTLVWGVVLLVLALASGYGGYISLAAWLQARKER